MRQLLQELKRRNVYKVAVAYAAAAFVVVQAARLLVPALLLPDWIYRAVVLAAILGFPMALVIAWAFELTPEGVQRTSEEVDEAEDTTSMSPEERRSQSRLAMKALVGLGLVGAAVAGGWYLLDGGGESEPEPRAGDRSIAVLPFQTLSPGEDSETFARGIHDDLLARLSNISDLKVISRTSVMQYKETDLELPAIAESLGVRWVMEGGVQEMSDQIQVNAQLIDPRTDTHAWADTYRRELTAADLFALQSEITKKIARSLEAELTPEETERVERQPTEDLDAYQLYVEGRQLLAQRGPEELQKAIRVFQQVLDRDSTYALAWAGLADALGLGRFYELDPPESVAGAKSAAHRALEQDPELAEAHASMGFVHLLDRDGPAALRALHRAVELKPSYAQAQHWLGAAYLVFGRREAALRHLKLAVKLDPQHKTAREWLANAYLADGKAQESLREAQEARRNTPNEVPPFALLQLGRIAEAQEVGRRALATSLGADWEDPHQRAALAVGSMASGDSAEAREHLAELGKEPADAVARGVIHAALGEEEEALAALESVENWGIRAGQSVVTVRYYYPNVLGPLRETSRYDQLIRGINQQWGLNPDGSLPDSVDVSFDP